MGMEPAQNIREPRLGTTPAWLLPSHLSSAEERVLPFLCSGWDAILIARELQLPEEVVRGQVHSCLAKFGLADTQELRARLAHASAPN